MSSTNSLNLPKSSQRRPKRIQNTDIEIYSDFILSATRFADMVLQSRLNDAAIALFRVLNAAGIKHGIFGGYAIGTLNGPRESKDIDCLASVSKAQIIGLLNGKEGFQFIDQSRDDYVAFFWSNQPNRQNAVLVEIFVERFNGTVQCPTWTSID